MTDRAARRIVAVFDFDGTLVAGDSLWPFLVRAAGRVWASTALAEAVARFAAPEHAVVDTRSGFSKQFSCADCSAGEG